MSRRIKQRRHICQDCSIHDVISAAVIYKSNGNAILNDESPCDEGKKNVEKATCITQVHFGGWLWGITNKRKAIFCCHKKDDMEAAGAKRIQEELEDLLFTTRKVKLPLQQKIPGLIRHIVKRIARVDHDLGLVEKPDCMEGMDCVAKIIHKGAYYGINSDLKIKYCCEDYSETIEYGSERKIEEMLQETKERLKFKF